MQRAIRGKQAVIGTSIGLMLLAASMGAVVAQTGSATSGATPASDQGGMMAEMAHAAPGAGQMDEMMQQCMDMMAMMMGNMSGMMTDDGSAAPIMQR